MPENESQQRVYSISRKVIDDIYETLVNLNDKQKTIERKQKKIIKKGNNTQLILNQIVSWLQSIEQRLQMTMQYLGDEVSKQDYMDFLAGLSDEDIEFDDEDIYE